MKISIDTKEDSHEDIKKIISMLSALVEGHSKESYGSYSPMDIFGDSGIPNASSQSNTTDNPPIPQETSAGTGGIFDLFKDDKIQGQQNQAKQENTNINPEDPVTLATY